jgi:hypothetical protein
MGFARFEGKNRQNRTVNGAMIFRLLCLRCALNIRMTTNGVTGTITVNGSMNGCRRKSAKANVHG